MEVVHVGSTIRRPVELAVELRLANPRLTIEDVCSMVMSRSGAVAVQRARSVAGAADMRQCTICGQVKHTLEFRARNDRRSGVHSHCLECYRRNEAVGYWVDKGLAFADAQRVVDERARQRMAKAA